jgi:hypothetical protein
VLKGVLQALRDRLKVEEAVQFGAQFPMLVRGFDYEGWRPAQVPLRIRRKEQFLDTVRNHLHDMLNEAPPLDVEQGVRVCSRSSPGTFQLERCRMSARSCAAISAACGLERRRRESGGS